MERNFELLKEVLAVPTKTYQEDLMIDFITNWLDENQITYYVDNFYNIYATKQTDENIGISPVSLRTQIRYIQLILSTLLRKCYPTLKKKLNCP